MPKSMHPPVKLYYFPLMGRAETLRMMMSYVGMPYTDSPIEFGEWPKHKATMPGGCMPVLEFPDGKKMGQSVPMAIYIGKFHNLHP